MPSLFPLDPDDDDDDGGKVYDRTDAEQAVKRDIDITARLVDLYDTVVPALLGVWVGQSSVGINGARHSHDHDLDCPERASVGLDVDVWCMLLSDAGEQVNLEDLQLHEK